MRRADRKARTRAAIVQAALELFARDGFGPTTLPAIAAAAGVSPRTVSIYFPTKDHIAFAGYPSALEALRERLEQDGPVLDALEDWVERVLAPLRPRAAVSDPELWSLEQRQLREATGLVAAALAAERGCDPAAARMAGAAALAALLEPGARQAAAAFLRAGLAAL